MISNGVINLSAHKTLAPSPRLRGCCGPAAGWPSPTSSGGGPWGSGPARQADLWAACIAGAMAETDLVLAVGGRPACACVTVRESPQYGFVSERARRTGATYGAKSVSLLAVKP